jgi:hypothetical protein
MLGLLVLTFDNISAMNRGDEIFFPVVECTGQPEKTLKPATNY